LVQRFSPEGSIDLSFSPQGTPGSLEIGPAAPPEGTVVHPSGQIFVATSHYREETLITRLQEDGTVISSAFAPVNGDLLLDPQGRMVIVGRPRPLPLGSPVYPSVVRMLTN